MVYELSFRHNLFEKEQIIWENGTTVKLFTTFMVLAAILASPKHRAFSSGLIVPLKAGYSRFCASDLLITNVHHMHCPNFEFFKTFLN